MHCPYCQYPYSSSHYCTKLHRWIDVGDKVNGTEPEQPKPSEPDILSTVLMADLVAGLTATPDPDTFSGVGGGFAGGGASGDF